MKVFVKAKTDKDGKWQPVAMFLPKDATSVIPFSLVDSLTLLALPQWEPTWVAAEAIDRTLDYGQNKKLKPEHPRWENEPVEDNIDHIIQHIGNVALHFESFGKLVSSDIVDLEHALTRISMMLGVLRRQEEEK